MLRRLRSVVLTTLVVSVASTLVAPIASAADGQWVVKASAPSARDEVGYVKLNNFFYLIGGSTQVSRYDPGADTWSNVAPLPENLDHVQAVATNGKIYVVGGLNTWQGVASTETYVYDPSTNDWTTAAPNPSPRGASGIAVHDGKIYVAGGMSATVPTNRFDVYDPATNQWTQLANMPRTREHFHAVVYGGKFWAIGGRNFQISNTVAQTDAYDFATSQWETGFAQMPTQRGGYAAGVLGTEIIVIGGERDGISRPEVEAYSPSSNTWRSLTDMAVPRHGIQAAECSGGLYIAAGATDQGGGSATAAHDAFFLGSPSSCGGSPPAIGFGRSSVAGITGSGPTTLAWGPDGKLYVGYIDGTIRAFTIVRDAANDYRVTATQTIDTIAQIVNHDDDGATNASVTGRLLLGIVLAGTAANPVIYATSSDPRIGGGLEGQDLDLDTNSGTLSRLTWNGSSWAHVILVRGLPRSEENHGPNGIALDPTTNTIYWAYGGNTNKGGPSFNFANLPEYAYAAAILSVDLDAIGSTTFTMPTLDDQTRANSGGADVNDPWGGNDGLNQAKIVAGSPVQVFAPGFRNAYDVLRTTVGQHAGKLYTSDNGPNGGWGDTPAGEGTNDCTNATVGQAESGSNDALHLVSSGYYGGHANPTRGNDANTFNPNNPQTPVPTDNPVECDWRASNGPETTALTTLPNSSNGIAEYTTNNFGGQMLGDLIIASYQARKIVRVTLNEAGTAVTSQDDNFATFNQPARPLDVTTMGASQAFPGTIWIADLNNDEVVVLEPNDFGGGGGPGCTGEYSLSLDEDGDGYSNADEIDNATSPCSAASVPPDNDLDDLSDLNDPDDDNDGVNDLADAFAIDPDNGTTTSLPVVISWENDQQPPGGIANTGFTGLMLNGTVNYLDQFDENGMVVGGAAGVFTVSQVPNGDAYKLGNEQEYGFQLGVDAPSAPFQVYGRIVQPFLGFSAERHQAMGIFIGDGTQGGYVKITTKGVLGTPEKINVIREIGDVVQTTRNKSLAMPGPDFVDLWLIIDPVASTVQPVYQASIGGVLQAKVNVGLPIPIPSSWLSSPTTGLAAGLISTSRGTGDPFPASWDFFHVEAVP